MHDEIEIEASLEKVWQAFIDLTCWADWNSVLTDVSPGPAGCIEEGGKFTCCVRPLGFPVFFEAKIEEVEIMKRVVWTGARHMVKGRNEWVFDVRDGRIIVASQEVLTGLPVLFGGLFFPVAKFRRLKESLLADLKKYAEGGHA
jgi:hypothetical protein